MLAKLPLSVQHAVLVLVASLLTWGGTSIQTLDLPMGVKAVLAGFGAWVLGYLAPFINSYGYVGNSTAE